MGDTYNVRMNSTDEGTGRREFQRRKEPRMRPSQPLEVEILGVEHRKLPAQILDISANGLSALVSTAVAAGMVVKIETDEALLLAEICYCQPQGDGFRI